MRQEEMAPENVQRVYLAVLHRAIVDIRYRIRCGESIDMQGIHDLMDGIHNIPEMLCGYGDWHVEKNIDFDLNRYDEKWCKPTDTGSRRHGLMKTLAEEKNQTNTSATPQPKSDAP